MIELGKKYKTRDGRDVRIYAVDGANACPVHGAVNLNGNWYPETWPSDGSYGAVADLTLVEVLPEVTVRKYVFPSEHSVFTADIPSFANRCFGAIDITHNGKEITDVKVVK